MSCTESVDINTFTHWQNHRCRYSVQRHLPGMANRPTFVSAHILREGEIALRETRMFDPKRPDIHTVLENDDAGGEELKSNVSNLPEKLKSPHSSSSPVICLLFLLPLWFSLIWLSKIKNADI